MRAARLLASVAWLALALPALARAEWIARIEPALGFDSNVSRAQERADIVGDETFAVAASGGRLFALSDADLLTLTLDLKETQYARFRGLNHFEAGPALAYRRKFGLGRMAPWMALSASAAHDDYASAPRDGNRLTLQLAGGRRFGLRADASAGLAYDRRDAHGGPPAVPGLPGNAFDLHGASAFVRLGFDVAAELRVAMRLSLRHGDVESSSRPAPRIYAVADAIAEDEVFGSEFYSYRLKGTTLGTAVNLSWALSPRSAANLAGSFARTAAAGGIDYRSTGAELSYVYRY